MNANKKDRIFSVLVQHVTFSTRGGAGRVALTLNEALIDIGIQSSVWSLTQGQIQSLVLRRPFLVLRALIDFFLVRKSRKSHLFTLYRNNSIFRLHRRLFPNSVVLHLHWTPGVMNLTELVKQVNNPTAIIWTMHDMWPISGGCHHSLNCTQFQKACQNCPQVRPVFKNKVMREFAIKEKQVADLRSRLILVAPSHWLAKQVSLSAIAKNVVIRVIPNPVDCKVFRPLSKGDSRKAVGIPLDNFVIGCAASDLADPMKNISEILSNLETLSINHGNISFLAIGANPPKSTALWVNSTGLLGTDQSIATALNSMDVLVSISEAETYPLAIAESLSCGIPVITINKGGAPELVVESSGGIVIESESELVHAIEQLINDVDQRQAMAKSARTWAVNTIDTKVVASQYAACYMEAVNW